MKKYLTPISYIVIILLPLVVFSIINSNQSNDLESKSNKINELNANDTINDYNISKTKSKKIENTILNIVADRKKSIQLKEIDGIASNIVNKLNLDLLNLSSDIEYYLNDTKYEIENRNKKSKIEYLKEYSEIHYFLDSENGKLSQTFIFWFPDGVISRIELIWLGGKCIEEKIFSDI